jgi:hypothetical protein
MILVDPPSPVAGRAPSTVLSAMIALALVGGCQSRTPITSSFDPRPAQVQLKPGSNTINGSAFMRKASGSIVTAAGEIVYLIPATAYAEERFAKLFPRGKLNPASAPQATDAADADYARLMRQTKADKQGQFQFDNVGAGVWFVSTRVTWSDPRERLPAGGAIYERVEIKGQGQTVDVIVSGN